MSLSLFVISVPYSKKDKNDGEDCACPSHGKNDHESPNPEFKKESVIKPNQIKSNEEVPLKSEILIPPIIELMGEQATYLKAVESLMEEEKKKEEAEKKAEEEKKAKAEAEKAKKAEKEKAEKENIKNLSEKEIIENFSPEIQEMLKQQEAAHKEAIDSMQVAPMTTIKEEVIQNSRRNSQVDKQPDKVLTVQAEISDVIFQQDQDSEEPAKLVHNRSSSLNDISKLEEPLDPEKINLQEEPVVIHLTPTKEAKPETVDADSEETAESDRKAPSPKTVPSPTETPSPPKSVRIETPPPPPRPESPKKVNNITVYKLKDEKNNKFVEEIKLGPETENLLNQQDDEENIEDEKLTEKVEFETKMDNGNLKTISKEEDENEIKIDNGHLKTSNKEDEEVENIINDTESPTEEKNMMMKMAKNPDEWVRAELDYLNVNYTSQISTNKTTVIFQFLYPQAQSEMLLSKFLHYSIGKIKETSINVLNPSVSNVGYKDKPVEKSNAEDEDEEQSDEEEETQMTKFLSSMKSRMMVRQVFKTVEEKGQFSFDFMCFLICAAIIAACGLAANSSVAVVASMLISPVMGPILYLTFGLRLRKKDAVFTGIKNMTYGIIIIFATGFFLLFILVALLLLLKLKEFPSKEMVDRGLDSSLLLGVIVAFSSSYGVCVSVLQGDHSTNIGVAISASLLPPVVNSGMMLAYLLILAAKPSVLISPPSSSNGTVLSAHELTPPNCTFIHLETFTYTPIYSCNMVTEMAILSGKSFALCVLNILLIILGGYLWLVLKEVAPDKTTKNSAIKMFFKRDIKEARQHYKDIVGDEQTKIMQDIYREYAMLRNPKTEEEKEQALDEFSAIVPAIYETQNFQAISNMQGLRQPFARNVSYDGAGGSFTSKNMRTQRLIRRLSFMDNPRPGGIRFSLDTTAPIVKSPAKKIGRFKVNLGKPKPTSNPRKSLA